jgi:hypothetical protein
MHSSAEKMTNARHRRAVAGACKVPEVAPSAQRGRGRSLGGRVAPPEPQPLAGGSGSPEPPALAKRRVPDCEEEVVPIVQWVSGRGLDLGES